MKKVKIALIGLLTVVGTTSMTNKELVLIPTETLNISTLLESTTSTFTVYGNCSMCESRIEGSLKKVKGIKSADWDVDSKKITVVYDSEVISLKEIKQKIANVGHDMDDVKATEKSYSGLMGCCQYERN